MLVTSGAISGTMSLEQVTLMPSRTRDAAWARFSGVIRFRVPSWSSGPQRPQLLRDDMYPRTSASEGIRLVDITTSPSGRVRCCRRRVV